MKKHKKETIKRVVAMICAALVALAFVLSVIMPAMAAPSKNELDAAKQKTDTAEKEYKAAEERKKAAIADYEAIDRQISETESEISIIETQIEQTKTDLANKEEELRQAEEEYNKYEQLFLTRARAMYETGDLAYIEILFGAESFSDFLSKMEVVTQLLEYDDGVLKILEETKKKIFEAKQEIEEILKRQEENHDALQSRVTTLESNLKKKEQMIIALAKDVETYKAVFESAERAEQELIRQNQNALSYAAYPVKYTGGKFLWPVPSSGKITSPYGYRIHPVYKTRKFHSGIDIAGMGYGKDIVAVADGTVTLAETNGGYGKCIIINHGSGISTLYGHNSSLLVSKGTKVTRGQVIAKSGSTGVSTGPHLHFEVRVNGSTTEPMNYFK